MRGRTLVLADVEGSWQATGRRVSGRFEVLGATGDSFILLDRYTGKVFSAGPSTNENLVLNQINLVAGLPVQIKAVEVHLEDQTLSDALAAVYSMQREPGLQHIFISGDLVLPSDRDSKAAGLATDLAQTTLRKVEARDPAGNAFRVQYLTAAELIKLAPIAVDRADLVIVATYTNPATGPTVTPLPSPPATSHSSVPPGDGAS
jgi:hypothetical protein